MEIWPVAALPANWRKYPAPTELQAIGDKWISQNRSLALQVPSVIIENEFNYLLNPAHSSFKSVTISAPTLFEFDPRIIR
jgi:RES domain-containing protein